MKTDVLIIGSGIAGLYAALNIDPEFEVYIVTKKNSAESNTNYAQGGIASVIDPTDSFQKHIEDTLIAGAGLCNKETVEILVKEGPERIYDLVDLGTKFTYKDGISSRKRRWTFRKKDCTRSDLTGSEVERVLLDTISQRNKIHLLKIILQLI